MVVVAEKNVVRPKWATGSGVQVGAAQLDGASAIHSAESVSAPAAVKCFTNDAPVESLTSLRSICRPAARTSAVTVSPGRTPTGTSTAVAGNASYQAE